MSKIIVLAVLILIFVGAFVLINSMNQPAAPTNQIVAPDNNSSNPSPTPTATVNTTTKTFQVDAKPYSFTPNEIRVKQGDTVKITLNNTEGFHDFVIDEFVVATKQIQAGQTETVEFKADKKGTFEYYCSVGNHRELGMKGNLVVE